MAPFVIVAILLGSLVDVGPSRLPGGWPLAAGRTRAENADVAAIRAVLTNQVAAWNRGDLDAFMAGYDNAETTTFISGDTVTRGWKTVLDRYKKSYDSRDKMGTVAFSDLNIARRTNQYVVTGKWQLTRQADVPRGGFTLVFRRTSAGWRIVHDHTTTAQ